MSENPLSQNESENINNSKYVKLSGVILSRFISGESNFILTLFLKQLGIITATAPNAIGTMKFGGSIEPTSWGIFSMRLSTRYKGYVIESAEIIDDMLNLKIRPEAIKCFMNWGRILSKRIPHKTPDDALLKILYDDMNLLNNFEIPVSAINFRFMWRWLLNWGLAPDFKEYFIKSSVNKNFSVKELKLLYYLTILDAKNLNKLFSQNNVKEFLSDNLISNPKFFDLAVNFISKFLNQT